MIGRGRGAVAFVDDDFIPPHISGCVLWVKAEIGLTVSGGTISRWADQSGLSHDLLQAIQANQPTYNTTGGPLNRPYISAVAASNQFMQTAPFTLNQPEHVFLTGKFTTATVAGTLIDGNTGNHMRVFRNGATTVTGYAGVQLVGAVTTPQNWHVYDTQFNGASSGITIDGTSATTGNAGANNGGGVTICDFGGGAGDPADCGITDIIIYNRTLTSAEETAVNVYLRGISGL